MKYPDDFINQIICGDCLETMGEMPDNCIETIITDPPYNLTSTTRPRPDQSENGSYGRQVPFSRQQSRTGFMGKNWDGTGISFDIKLWEEALRVAKPGATLLCFGGTRTYHRLACAIEDAGWILKDCIMWLYGSGFPKATDISKQLQKQSGKEPKILGRNPNSREKCDKSNTLYESGTVGKTDYITKPTDKNATLWNGWKSHGLKPSYEPILVAMKPNEGSYANNALKWGVAGLNVEGGRIPLNGDKKIGGFGNAKSGFQKGIGNAGDPEYKTEWIEDTKGRFPANVILDEEAARMLDEKAPKTGAFAKVKSGHSGKSKGIYHDYAQRGDDGATFYSDGLQGASRFFYCAKASKAERNRGCEGLEEKIMKQNFTSEICIDNREGRVEHKRPNIKFKNTHPTVKPLALMKYLCTLTLTPTGGIVLDPFCGSGTTLVACKELKRDYIGIDNNSEYCEIAIKRINSIPDLLF